MVGNTMLVSYSSPPEQAMSTFLLVGGVML
jgi:hypothetical protein